MTKKAKVLIRLEKSGADIKVIVTTLQRHTTMDAKEIWVRNLEVTTEDIEFELDEKVAQMLTKGALMDALADAVVAYNPEDVTQEGPLDEDGKPE